MMGMASKLEWRCACCGYSSANGSFFRFERVGLLSRKRSVCGGCKPYVPTKREASAYVYSSFMISVGTVIIASGWRGAEILAYWFLFGGALVLSGIVTVAVHEWGHATMARLVGMKVVRVVLGSGPIVAVRHWKGVRLELRAFLPVQGITYAYHRLACPTKWRDALFIVGGVVANLAFAAAAILMFALLFSLHRTVNLIVVTAGYGVIASQMLAVIQNLFPRTIRVGGATFPSDGKRLIGLAWSKDFRIDAAVARLLWEGMSLIERNSNEEALRHFERASSMFPASPSLFALLVHSAGKARGSHDAVKRYFDHGYTLSDPDEGQRSAVVLAYANVAWHAAMTQDPTLLPLADELSKRAMEMLPDAPHACGARGAVLIQLRQREAGMELLTKALRKTEQTGDRVDLARALASAERAGGNTELADEIVRYANHIAGQA